MKTAFRFLLQGALLCATAAHAVSETAPAAAPTPDARHILMTMAQHLAKAPGFTVTIQSDYDAVQANGQSIAFSEKRLVQLNRPSHLRVDSTRSDDDKGIVLFDGKMITAANLTDNAYARVEKSGTVDDAVIYLVKDLQMTLPLARMLLTTLPQELDKQFKTIDYVERDVLTEVPSHHLAARTDEVDVQLWISDDAQALPQRIVIIYKNEPGQPQFRAELRHWHLGPALTDDLFNWTPPAGMELIPFLAPVNKRLTASPQDTTPKNTAQQGVQP